jgi:hypothetical protein
VPMLVCSSCAQVTLVDCMKADYQSKQGLPPHEIIDACTLLRAESARGQPLLSWAGPGNIVPGSAKVVLKFPVGSCELTMRYAWHMKKHASCEE